MTATEALAGVYPNFADAPARLAWNREREQELMELPPCDDVELLLRTTRTRIAMLEDLVSGPTVSARRR